MVTVRTRALEALSEKHPVFYWEKKSQENIWETARSWEENGLISSIIPNKETWTWWKDREVRHKLSSIDERLTNKSASLTSAVAMLSCECFGIDSTIIVFTKDNLSTGN